MALNRCTENTNFRSLFHYPVNLLQTPDLYKRKAIAGAAFIRFLVGPSAIAPEPFVGVQHIGIQSAGAALNELLRAGSIHYFPTIFTGHFFEFIICKKAPGMFMRLVAPVYF